jgi:choline dehydrogenase-like flavoprotein
MVIRVVGEQLGNPESRVTLDRATDALGIPRAQLHWRISRADRESIARGLALFARELGRRQLGRVRIEVEGHSPKSVSDEDVADFDFSPTQSFHHMGTARMHQDPTRGVVDRDCRVHDVANLFVAGSAVFPSTSMATPTLTLVALALRLAAHLRTELA